MEMLQLTLLYLCASVSALLFPPLSLESPLEGGESLQLDSVRGILPTRYSPTCYYPDGSVAADFNYTTCNHSKREILKTLIASFRFNQRHRQSSRLLPVLLLRRRRYLPLRWPLLLAS
jgi:hypothetical protein